MSLARHAMLAVTALVPEAFSEASRNWACACDDYCCEASGTSKKIWEQSCAADEAAFPGVGCCATGYGCDDCTCPGEHVSDVDRVTPWCCACDDLCCEKSGTSNEVWNQCSDADDASYPGTGCTATGYGCDFCICPQSTRADMAEV